VIFIDDGLAKLVCVRGTRVMANGCHRPLFQIAGRTGNLVDNFGRSATAPCTRIDQVRRDSAIRQVLDTEFGGARGLFVNSQTSVANLDRSRAIRRNSDTNEPD